MRLWRLAWLSSLARESNQLGQTCQDCRKESLGLMPLTFTYFTFCCNIKLKWSPNRTVLLSLIESLVENTLTNFIWLVLLPISSVCSFAWLFYHFLTLLTNMEKWSEWLAEKSRPQIFATSQIFSQGFLSILVSRIPFNPFKSHGPPSTDLNNVC